MSDDIKKKRNVAHRRAYIALLMLPYECRDYLQEHLCRFRDLISAFEGRSIREIQTECEEIAGRARGES